MDRRQTFLSNWGRGFDQVDIYQSYCTAWIKDTLSPFRSICPVKGGMLANGENKGSNKIRQTQVPSLFFLCLGRQTNLDGIINYQIHKLIKALHYF
jgi:hypothetical protein